MNRLSLTLAGQRRNLTDALDNLAPGIQVVVRQHDQLVGMLQSVNRLSEVAVDTIGKSKNHLIDNLRALTPTLAKLAEAGQNLPTALKILPTYPLPDVAGDALRGDYGNVKARLDLDLDSILQNVENAGKVSISLPNAPAPITLPTAPPPLPLPGAPAAPAPNAGGPSLGILGDILGGLLGGGR